ncbi:Acetyltransferase (GNAT) family protein [Micromonospora pattaloongensis]|uniref:Acetyltransferase (GNAT) family protein n=1 Tax=Micromonospora pattaloongensis TaxID=405436 RepID=A0A1H3PHB6_9ACTN|nr:GNAT family N-acetyltransferase [Micromonospora pattaloongensis]SDY99799.1 Acetyltransferase (GNAT) family protein [Micromonospora pattaloongensis]
MTRTRPAVAIRTGTTADTDVITALLAEAFLTGPVADWLVPDPRRRRDAYLAFFRQEVERALRGGYVHLATDQSAVALWQLRMRPPAESAERPERLPGACAPFADRFAALAAAFADHHPTVPHHYLAYLAVAPPRQNRGVGAALLRHQHAALDRAGIPAYLEASNGDNRRLYLRHGYRSAAPFHLPFDGPPLWPMWRDPRAV